MKEVIKITIALAFILGAYIIGNQQKDERHKLKIEDLNKNIILNKENISHLQDSISKLKQIIDTLKVKIAIIVPPKEADKIRKGK